MRWNDTVTQRPESFTGPDGWISVQKGEKELFYYEYSIIMDQSICP